MHSLRSIAAGTVLGALGVVTAVPHPSNCSGQWTTLAKLPEPRQEHSTVAINDHTIAVVGGITVIFNGTSQVGLATTNLVQLYDIPSDSWRTVAPAPYKVNHPNVATHGGKIYLLGGLVEAQDPPPAQGVNWVASRESHVYDPATDSWIQLEPMPAGTERGSAIVGVHGEMIYLAGGMTILTEYQDSLTMVTGFNTSSGEWQRLPAIAANIPEGRQHGVGSVVGDIFYVAGGRWFSQTAVRGEVFMLNLTNQEAGWQTSAGHMPVPRGGISGAAIGNRLFTFGGEGNVNSDSGIFNESEAFDGNTQQWAELTPMAVPRHGTSAASVGNKVYIPGGGLQQDGKIVIVDGVPRFLASTDHFDVFSVEK